MGPLPAPKFKGSGQRGGKIYSNPAMRRPGLSNAQIEKMIREMPIIMPGPSGLGRGLIPFIRRWIFSW